MILSMTGYASLEHRHNSGVLLIELRAVNHRYLELQLKLDDDCRPFEAAVREQLNAKLGRGKVDCRISLIQDAAADTQININHQILQQIASSASAAAVYFPNAQAVNILELLRMPGVMVSQVADTETLENAVKTSLAQAIASLILARSREGEKLKTMVLERLTEVKTQLENIKPLLPTLIKNYQAKLLEKFNEASLSVDDERVRQEIVLYAQRVDVDEELTRLTAHISEVAHILSAGGLVGKRLDFLMQEMNREANTLGAKSMAIETTQTSMRLKVLIEQMREQIQNIE